MANELIELIEPKQVLTKGCSEVQLKQYFTSLLALYKSGEGFPVNLDDVWPLVYSAKNKAVRALKESFIENEDYVLLPQNGKQTRGGHNEVIYHLTVSCMEYLIAKKVRSVFGVYREVFKKIATGEVAVMPKTQEEILLMQTQLLVDHKRKMMEIENKQQELEEKVSEIAVRTKTDIKYTTIVGFAKRFGIELPLQKAATLGTAAKNLCQQYLLEMGKVPDPRFGTVRTYPDSVLYEIFEKYYPAIRFR